MVRILKAYRKGVRFQNIYLLLCGFWAALDSYKIINFDINDSYWFEVTNIPFDTIPLLYQNRYENINKFGVSAHIIPLIPIEKEFITVTDQFETNKIDDAINSNIKEISFDEY